MKFDKITYVKVRSGAQKRDLEKEGGGLPLAEGEVNWVVQWRTLTCP